MERESADVLLPNRVSDEAGGGRWIMMKQVALGRWCHCVGEHRTKKKGRDRFYVSVKNSW